MDRVHWDHAVFLICRASGQILVVSSPREALTLLTTQWPVHEGRAFVRALQVCSDVAEGRRKPEEARLALLDAAEEAGVPVTVSA